MFKRAQTPSKSGRRPNIAKMGRVTAGHAFFNNVSPITAASRLWILTDVQKTIGRQFSFSFEFQDGYLFDCMNCKNLTTNGQKAKAFVQFTNGKYVVRQGKHYVTCRPVFQVVPPEVMKTSNVAPGPKPK